MIQRSDHQDGEIHHFTYPSEDPEVVMSHWFGDKFDTDQIFLNEHWLSGDGDSCTFRIARSDDVHWANVKTYEIQIEMSFNVDEIQEEDDE